MTLQTFSRSEEQTASLAAGVARLLKSGDTVFLKGQLGTGKTFFIRAAARQLGVTEPVTSPSFTMGQTYSGDVTVHHLDLYRLTSFDSDDLADFEPFFERGAVTFIEWPEQAEPALEPPRLTIRIYHVDPESRRLEFESADAPLMRNLENLIADLGL